MVNVLFLLKPDRLEAIFLFLGLPMRPMGGASVVMNDRVLGNLDDIREQLGPATYRPFLQFDRLAKDRMTPLEFYYSDHPEDTFNWDVLTFVGTALILLDGLRRVPLPIAALAAAIGLLISPILRGQADYAAYWQNGYFECDLTLSNLLIGFLCTGYFPIFPWIAFSLCGYVAAAKLFGPIDAEESLVSPWTLVWLGAALIALSLLAIRFRIYLPDPIGNNYLGGWTMFPPTIEYVVGTLGMSLAMLGLSHRWIDRNPEALRWKGCSISRGRSAVIRYPFISCIISFTCGPFGSTVFPVASSRPIFG